MGGWEDLAGKSPLALQAQILLTGGGGGKRDLGSVRRGQLFALPTEHSGPDFLGGRFRKALGLVIPILYCEHCCLLQELFLDTQFSNPKCLSFYPGGKNHWRF